MYSKTDIFIALVTTTILACALFMIYSAVASLIWTSFSLSTIWWLANLSAFASVLWIEYDMNHYRQQKRAAA